MKRHDSDHRPGRDEGTDTEQRLLCPVCRGDFLSLMQPDVDLPDRLLGICPLCKDWFVIEADGRLVTAISVAHRSSR